MLKQKIFFHAKEDSPMKVVCNVAVAALAAALGLYAGGASAAQDVQARSWAASCAACHGTEGRSVGGMPALAGKRREELAEALQAFKAGRRPATVMHQHAKGYTDAELERLADFFSRQKR
jgi:cytochrome c553